MARHWTGATLPLLHTTAPKAEEALAGNWTACERQSTEQCTMEQGLGRLALSHALTGLQYCVCLEPESFYHQVFFQQKDNNIDPLLLQPPHTKGGRGWAWREWWTYSERSLCLVNGYS